MTIKLVTNNMEVLAGSLPTMSSLDIAELTGKQHNNVTRDILVILKQAGISPLKFEQSYFDSRNKKRTAYYLPKRECDLLISGYSVKYRLAIIDRWIVLEKQVADTNPAFPDFTDPHASALAWAAEYKSKTIALSQVSELEPQAIAFSVVADTANKISVSNWIKLLQTEHGLDCNMKTVREWLCGAGYCYKLSGVWQFAARYSVLFESKLVKWENGKACGTGSVLYLTPKGIKKLTPLVISALLNKCLR